MNTDVKKLWIEDLRANPGTQGTGNLKIGDKYCCLGRLCLLAVDAGVLDHFPVDKDIPGDTLIPLALIDWAGIDYAGLDNLAFINDRGATFPEIADIIEKTK